MVTKACGMGESSIKLLKYDRQKHAVELNV